MGQPQTRVEPGDLPGLVAEVVNMRPEWRPGSLLTVLRKARELVGWEPLERITMAVAADYSANTPGAIRTRVEQFVETTRPATRSPILDGTHCGRAGCECRHTPGECVRGFLDDDAHLSAAFKCPVCWNS